ncbi:hypothetical protein SUGI_0293800 [Cryptomeria japonica]|nr:hypothetical protein SUGI_0293800 [Cryptomeria japonica]
MNPTVLICFDMVGQLDCCKLHYAGKGYSNERCGEQPSDGLHLQVVSFLGKDMLNAIIASPKRVGISIRTYSCKTGNGE